MGLIEQKVSRITDHKSMSDSVRVELPGPGAMEECCSLAHYLDGEYKTLLQAEGIEYELMASQLQHLYLPIALWLFRRANSKTHVLGISGAQGTGKSTLCRILALILVQGFGKRVCCVSLDDLYLTRAQRLQRAGDIHPLLQTRGVPGTHDVELGIQLFKTLTGSGTGKLSCPVFDKAKDDRAKESQWNQIELPVDIVLFEGWCVAARSQSIQALYEPMNSLEAEEDSQGLWRRYVNQVLGDEYQALFEFIDTLILLKAPDIESVYQWRLKQEVKLRQKTRDGLQSQVMSEKTLQRFIMHYERITWHCLQEMPQRADLLLELGQEQQVLSATTRQG